MSFRRDTPFNELPLLPPRFDTASPLLKDYTAKAHRALQALAEKMKELPDRFILVNSLLLLEAQDNSAIENIFTTKDKLFKAEILVDHRIEAATLEVKRCREALWQGTEAIRFQPLGAEILVGINQTLMNSNAGMRKAPGTRITTPNGKLIYTPPIGRERLDELFLNLEGFMHEESVDLDPLVKMAIMHYQFEAIHPFPDGNGRCGRIANILYLLEKKILRTPVLFFSRAILANKSLYYMGLRGVTEHNAWEPWILYMLRALEDAAQATTNVLESIRGAMAFFAQTLKAKDERLFSRDLVETLFLAPYCDHSAIQSNLAVSPTTATDYLARLEKCGLLEKQELRKSVIYLNGMLATVLYS